MLEVKSVMTRFVLKYKNRILGHTNFAYGDPSMGVASGEFSFLDEVTTQEFIDLIKSENDGSKLIDGNTDEDNGFYYVHLGSKFEMVSERGEKINILNGGISLELFEDKIQITAYGIEGQQYKDLFPYLIAACE